MKKHLLSEREQLDLLAEGPPIALLLHLLLLNNSLFEAPDEYPGHALVNEAELAFALPGALSYYGQLLGPTITRELQHASLADVKRGLAWLSGENERGFAFMELKARTARGRIYWMVRPPENTPKLYGGMMHDDEPHDHETK